MATTINITVNGESLPITISGSRDFSVPEALALEEEFGGMYGEWGRAMRLGSTRAALAAVLIFARRVNPALTLKDISTAPDVDSLFDVWTKENAADKPEAGATDAAEADGTAEAPDPTLAA